VNEPISGIEYGWFSAEQAALGGTVIYLGVNGKEYELSCVSASIAHGSGWRDLKFVAEVVRFLRPGRTGTLVESHYYPYD
jgi:hypothetical protein